MNWQLLKNVNPPLDKLLLFYSQGGKAIFFAIRKDAQLEMANTFTNGLRESWKCPYSWYKEMYGEKIYWTLFVKP